MSATPERHDAMHANGYPIAGRVGTHESLPARRLAVDLGRDHPAVQSLKVGSHNSDAVVRLDPDHGERHAATFEPPAGWRVSHINVAETNSATFVHLTRERDD